MSLLNFKPDLRTVLRSPLFISRIVSIIFIIIIIACIDRDGFWTFMFFVLFCYMTNHWQFSDAKSEVLNQVNLNNVRTAIAFVFFSIFSWGGMSYTSYHRYKSVQNYNQFADDVTSNIHGQTSADVDGSGYIDYFNQPPVPVQTGFDASMAADDEFIASGQHRASDTELLTS
ncbi:hypothetical protein ACTXT7_014919 [Hymenolepis weldensis]